MKNCDLLLHNVTALLPDHSLLSGADIAILGKDILDIGQNAGDEYTAKETLDGTGKLALPGLYDCHTHSVQQLLKGGTVDEPPIIWRRILVPYESTMNPEDRYHAARLFCMQSLKAGVVMFADAGSMEMEGVIEAVRETGIHATVARVGRDLDKELPACMCDPDADTCMKNQQALFDKFNCHADGRVRVFYSLSSPMTTSRELATMVGDAARKNNTNIHIHMGEHPAEVQTCLARFGMRPPEFLESCGALGDNVIAAHCIQITDQDMQVMKRTGMHVVHCPTANLPTQGIPKLLAERAAGLKIALGNDGATTAKQDILGQAQLLKYVTQPVYGTPVFEPNVLPLEEAFDMCTINGARALGVADRQGTLESGKRASIALYDIDNVNFQPSRNLFKSFMMVGGSNDLTDLILDGKVLIKGREFTELDEERILFEGKKQMEKLLKRTK